MIVEKQHFFERSLMLYEGLNGLSAPHFITYML